MKNAFFPVVAVLVLAVSLHALAQGPLTPSSSPGATMKTLDQVEARIPISGSSFTCSVAGASYYLAAPLVATGSSPVIRIVTNDVTVDLNGFSILGLNGTGNGVGINAACRNITIRNGTVRDCYYHGIYAATASRCCFERLQILGNGRYSAAYDGLSVGTDSQVRDCTIASNRVGLSASGHCRIENNRIEQNSVIGLQLTGSNTYVAGNVVRANADNYDLAADNQLNLLLCEIPENLDWPCSVKLAGTLSCAVPGTNGITVNSDNVTIDLDGHTLIGPGASSGSGIYQDAAQHNLAVRNGKATRWQGLFKAGFYLSGENLLLEQLEADTNYYGIYLGQNGSVNGCIARRNISCGFYASYGNQLRDCMAAYNGQAGIYGLNENALLDCTALYNLAHGIATVHGNTLRDCLASHNGMSGVTVSSKNLLTGIQSDSNGTSTNGSGISITGNDNRVEGNKCVNNTYGIQASATGNFIVRNTCSGNATNWDILVNNKVGEIVSAPNSGAILGDTGGAGVGSTDPWANFTY